MGKLKFSTRALVRQVGFLPRELAVDPAVML